jgi:hypothetical protein
MIDSSPDQFTMGVLPGIRCVYILAVEVFQQANRVGTVPAECNPCFTGCEWAWVTRTPNLPGLARWGLDEFAPIGQTIRAGTDSDVPTFIRLVRTDMSLAVS